MHLPEDTFGSHTLVFVSQQDCCFTIPGNLFERVCVDFKNSTLFSHFCRLSQHGFAITRQSTEWLLYLMYWKYIEHNIEWVIAELNTWKFMSSRFTVWHASSGSEKPTQKPSCRWLLEATISRYSETDLSQTSPEHYREGCQHDLRGFVKGTLQIFHPD